MQRGFDGNQSTVRGKAPEQAVYDPQAPNKPQDFSENGSTAERLAIVCNQSEARKIAGCESLEEADLNPMPLERNNATLGQPRKHLRLCVPVPV